LAFLHLEIVCLLDLRPAFWRVFIYEV